MGRVVLYLHHGKPCLGEVVGESKSKLKLLDVSGREIMLPEGRVILSLPKDMSLSEMERLSVEEAKAIDLELLHGISVLEEKKRFTVEELSKLYYGNSLSSYKVVAVFRAVYEDKLFFKRWKDFTFSPRAHEEVAALKEEERKKREEEEKVSRIVDTLKGIRSDDISGFLALLKLYVENEDVVSGKDKVFLERVLSSLSGKEGVKKTALSILKKWNLLEEDFEEELFLSGVRTRFPRSVEAFSEDVRKGFYVDVRDREDMRRLFSFAIDDEDTKEVDDALSYENREDVEIVYVHISDLTPTVIKDDPVDREAFKRGTSVYTPLSVYPMIPEPISFDIGSLLEKEERYAITFKFQFKDGELISYEIVPSVVAVSRRLSYEEADRLIREGGNGLSPVLKRLLSIAEALKTKRMSKGGFFLPKREVKIVKKGESFSIKLIDPLSPSRFLVSEFMILCNYVASRFCLENKIPVIYRSQPPPDEGIEMKELVYQEDLPVEVLKDVFSKIKPSRISLSPSYHWGLGLDSYVQITSPIRRYSDLILQRQIVSYILKGKPVYEEMDLMKVIALSEDWSKEVKGLERQLTMRALKEYLKSLKEPIPGTVKDRTNRGYLVSPLNIPVRFPLHSSRNLEFGRRIKIMPRSSNGDSLVFEDLGDL